MRHHTATEFSPIFLVTALIGGYIGMVWLTDRERKGVPLRFFQEPKWGAAPLRFPMNSGWYPPFFEVKNRFFIKKGTFS